MQNTTSNWPFWQLSLRQLMLSNVHLMCIGLSQAWIYDGRYLNTFSLVKSCYEVSSDVHVYDHVSWEWMEYNFTVYTDRSIFEYFHWINITCSLLSVSWPSILARSELLASSSSSFLSPLFSTMISIDYGSFISPPHAVVTMATAAEIMVSHFIPFFPPPPLLHPS